MVVIGKFDAIVELSGEKGRDHITFNMVIKMPNGKLVMSLNELDGGADMQALQRITDEIMDNI